MRKMDVTNDFQNSGINQGPGFGGFPYEFRRKGSGKKQLRSIEKEIFRSKSDIKDEIKDQLIGYFREVGQEFREVDSKLCDIQRDCQMDACEAKMKIAELKTDTTLLFVASFPASLKVTGVLAYLLSRPANVYASSELEMATASTCC